MSLWTAIRDIGKDVLRETVPGGRQFFSITDRLFSNKKKQKTGQSKGLTGGLVDNLPDIIDLIEIGAKAKATVDHKNMYRPGKTPEEVAAEIRRTNRGVDQRRNFEDKKRKEAKRGNI